MILKISKQVMNVSDIKKYHLMTKLFFSGAGVDMPAPTNAPNGEQLTKFVIDNFYPDDTFNALSYYRQGKSIAQLPHKNNNP